MAGLSASRPGRAGQHFDSSWKQPEGNQSALESEVWSGAQGKSPSGWGELTLMCVPLGSARHPAKMPTAAAGPARSESFPFHRRLRGC